MYSISTLLKKVPSLPEVQIVSSGYALWLVWPATFPDVVRRTFPNFGGWPVKEESNQALWFFFSDQVFSALARLHKWSQVNDLKLFVQALPAKVLISPNMLKSISVPNDYVQQKTDLPDKLDILIPGILEEKIKSVQGLSLKSINAWSGLAQVPWRILQVNTNLAYQSSLQWIFVLRPQGIAQDRNFSEGWRNFFAHIKKILSRQELRFLITEDYYLLVMITTLSQLKNWCLALLSTLKQLREEKKISSWPVVIVGVQKKKMDFTRDVPSKLGLDLSQFEPNVPYLPLLDAFLLGNEVELIPGRFVQEQSEIKGHVKLALPSGTDDKTEEGIFLPLPQILLAGSGQRCFYCGLKNHNSSACPTKDLVQWPTHIWEKLAEYSIEDIEKEFSRISKNKDLQNDKQSAFKDLLQGDEQKNLILHALFAICAPLQLRALRLVWRSRGKDWPEGLRQVTDIEDEYIWSGLENLRSKKNSASKKFGKQALLRYPRTFQPRTLLGFVAMEENETKTALSYWNDAQRFCYTPLQKSYHLMLRARLLEINREYDQAIASYQEAFKISPNFTEARYRQGVCFIKSGFIDQGLGLFIELFPRHTDLFNHMLLDPELERGHNYLLNNVSQMWKKTLGSAKQEGKKLLDLEKKLQEWSKSDRMNSEHFSLRISHLKRFHNINNFVAANRLIQGVPTLVQDFEEKINQEVQRLKRQTVTYMQALEDMQKEAAWFPFPKLLRGFNRDFKRCVLTLNEISQASLFEGEQFCQAQEKMQEVEAGLLSLKRRLATLALVRDSVVFFMFVGKGFLWLEAIGLVLSIGGVPVLLFVGKQIDQSWAVVFWEERWRFQKIALLALSVSALIIATIRATWRFESKKRIFLQKKRK